MRVCRIMAAMLCFLLSGILLFTACATPNISSADAFREETAMSSAETPAAGAVVAVLGTDAALETEFGQAVSTTVSKFAGELAMTSGVYRTEPEDTNLAVSTLELAAKGGARLVILLGEELENVALRAQLLFPEMQFILIGMSPDVSLNANGVRMQFSPEQGGWLAGYSAVYERNVTLGFYEVEEEQARKYMLGFLLGAEAAAMDMGLNEGAIQAYPQALGEDTREWRAQIDSLYKMDVSLVFANVPAAQEETLNAARNNNAQMIGLELGAYAPSSVLTSVTFDPQNVLTGLLQDWHAGRFPGGETVVGTVANRDIQLILDTTRLKRFGEIQYERIVDRFQNSGLAAEISGQVEADEETVPTPASLGLVYVSVVGPQENGSSDIDNS